MAKPSMSLAAKAALRVRRPLLRLAEFEWSSLAKAWKVFDRPLPVTLRYLEMLAVRRPWRVDFRAGASLQVRSGADVLCAWDCWVKEEYPVEGGERIIVDAGANIGAFSLYAARRAPGARIFALEPVKSTHADLVANIALSGLAATVTPLRKGVAGRSARVEIAVGADSANSSLYGDKSGAVEMVEVRSLKDLLGDIGDPAAVDLLKLDCEGAEMDCLLQADAATLSRFGRIAFEYHVLSGHSFAEVRAHLEACGFACRHAVHDPEHGVGLAGFARKAHPAG